MQTTNKLGEDRSITGLLPALVTLVSIALVWAVFGQEPAFVWTFLAFCIFTGFAAVAYLRTRSIGYLASMLYLLAASLMLAVRVGVIPGHHKIAPPFAILLMVSIVFLVYVLLTKQAKWRGRDLLELAAQPIDEISEGYTQRPHPVCKCDFSRREILAFSQFAKRKLIAMTYVEPERVVFVPVKMGTEFGYLFSTNRDYARDTWVAFENDGQVNVNISERDYFAFRDDFDFDQLCRSLADVFIEFMNLYQKGQETRILDRLDAMKVGVFS